jgi:hypothetical protein
MTKSKKEKELKIYRTFAGIGFVIGAILMGIVLVNQFKKI